MPLTTVAISDFPGADAIAIAPSDTVDQGPFRWLYVGGTGDVVLVTVYGNAVLLKAMPIGLYQMCYRRINATNTTATLMVGFT
jgi:hypothetical protein